jgi:hypothetical protein
VISRKNPLLDESRLVMSVIVIMMMGMIGFVAMGHG